VEWSGEVEWWSRVVPVPHEEAEHAVNNATLSQKRTKQKSNSFFFVSSALRSQRKITIRAVIKQAAQGKYI